MENKFYWDEDTLCLFREGIRDGDDYDTIKKRVENFVANFPQETKKIKKIDNYFKKNQLTYFNRNTNSYGGYKPSKSELDLAHLGITKSKELENQYSE